MYFILYTSEISVSHTNEEIMIMLNKARDYNNQHSITGMLLYCEKIFIQILEGEKEPVDYLFQKISKDIRHKNIRVVYSKDIDQRYFPEWSMGFKWISSEDLKKIEDLKDGTIKSYIHSCKPYKLLKLLSKASWSV